MGWFMMSGEFVKNRDARFGFNGLRFSGRLGLMVIFTLFSYKFFWEKVLQEELFNSRTAFVGLPLFWIGLTFLVGLLIYPFLRVDRGEMLRNTPET